MTIGSILSNYGGAFEAPPPPPPQAQELQKSPGGIGLNKWKRRGSRLIGKIQIIKSFVVPKLLYRADILSFVKGFLKEINSVLNDLWKGKDKVKRTAVTSGIQNRGLRMADIGKLTKAQRITVVRKLSK